MERTYEVTDRADRRGVAEFLKQEGQFLLPMVELVEQAELAIDEAVCRTTTWSTLLISSS